MLDTVYPVGSIYSSLESTSPASIFGGEWEAIEGGATLKSQGYSEEPYYSTDGTFKSFSFVVSGTTWGNNWQRLASTDIPNHQHYLGYGLSTKEVNAQYGLTLTSPGFGGRIPVQMNSVSRQDKTVNQSYTPTSFQNFGKILVVYMWKRTA